MSGGEESVVDDGRPAVAAGAGTTALDASADQDDDGAVDDTAFKGVSSRLHSGAPSNNNARDETTRAGGPGQRWSRLRCLTQAQHSCRFPGAVAKATRRSRELPTAMPVAPS